MKFCPECGNKLIDGAKFCPECGYKIANLNNVSNIRDVHIEEGYKNSDNSIKISSDEYIKKILRESDFTNIDITPNISEKKLVNASVSIAQNTDPNTLIALIDTSLLTNGKSGVVFTGSEFFIKNNFSDSLRVPFKDLLSAKHSIDTTFNKKGIAIEEEKVIIEYKDGATVNLNANTYGKDIPYKLLANFLNEFDKNVDKISSNNQVVQLNQMNEKIIKLYFRIIIAYLKDDDGIIDSKEYKELIILMTKVKISKIVAKELREYRFEHKENLTIDELIEELQYELNEADLSDTSVIQSLGMDMISMNSDKLDDLTNDVVLMRNLNRLNFTDKQIQFAVHKIKAEKKILEEIMTDSQIKETAKELAAIASGAGVSLGALAITGAVGGLGMGVTSGLFALAFTLSTGTLFVGLAAITSAGFGVYKGVKYFSGTGELEKYGIRIQALQDNIKQMRIANNYIIEDINWLSEKLSHFAEKLKHSNEMSNELYEEIKILLSQNQLLASAGTLIEEEELNSEYELLKTSVPASLNLSKYNELLAKNTNKVYADEVIKKAYVVSGDLDEQNDLSSIELKEDVTLEELETVKAILEEIGYFDTKAASIAQGKSLAKKGFSNFKKSFLGGEDFE
ncbi:TPA: zinc-ribbon domain-containing protein [Staphylococcus aureus]|nr:zinc-ribbon domain-containing protein [Staphylococcus aureus]HEP1176578.1 zinc-ribbon domain-containing protein [Staphylococcus aureus]